MIAHVGMWSFAKRVWKEIVDDQIFIWASALAYAWLFAVFPFLIFLLSLVPFLPWRLKVEAADPLRHAVEVLPERAATTLWDNIQNVMHRPHNGLLSLGFVVTVWAASGGMNMTISAMDLCYDLPKGRPFYKQRLLAIGLTMIATVFIMGVLVVLPLGALAERWVISQHVAAVSKGTIWLWNGARYVLAVILLFTLVAIVYYFGPHIHQQFQIITPGAVFTVIVWLMLEALFRFYVNKFGKYDQMYGAVGGVAILLLFFYIDAVVLLIGAEINSEIDFARGIPRGTYDFRDSATLVFHEPESSEDDDDETCVAPAISPPPAISPIRRRGSI